MEDILSLLSKRVPRCPLEPIGSSLFLLQPCLPVLGTEKRDNVPSSKFPWKASNTLPVASPALLWLTLHLCQEGAHGCEGTAQQWLAGLGEAGVLLSQQ